MKSSCFIFEFLLVIIFAIGLYSCDQESNIDLKDSGIDEEISLGLISELKGNYNPFELLTQPEYFNVKEINDINDDELVFAFSGRNGQVYVYPHRDLLIEVVNDQIDKIPLAINFCPLTKSGMLWDRRLDGDTLLLRASGWLIRDNLVIEDTLSGTLWSQMKLKGVDGSLMDKVPKPLNLLQLKWSVIEEYFRDALVFQHDCATSCQGRNDQDIEKEHSELNFDGDLKYGIVNSFKQSYTLFELSDFSEGWSLRRVGQNLIIGNEEMEQIIAFKTIENFELIQDSYPIILKDNSGSRWDVFGRAVDGPKKGNKLEATFAYWAIDYAWQNLFE